jgi:ABC-type Co2+ transport system permease subunit
MDTRSDAFSVRVILAGVVIVLLAMGVRATFGLFMLTMGPATGMGRDVFFYGVCPAEPYWGVACIAMGVPGRSLRSGSNDPLGALLYMLSLIGMRFSTGPLGLYLTAGLLMGFGQAGTTFSVLLPVVARAVRSWASSAQEAPWGSLRWFPRGSS